MPTSNDFSESYSPSDLSWYIPNRDQIDNDGDLSITSRTPNGSLSKLTYFTHIIQWLCISYAYTCINMPALLCKYDKGMDMLLCPFSRKYHLLLWYCGQYNVKKTKGRNKQNENHWKNGLVFPNYNILYLCRNMQLYKFLYEGHFKFDCAVNPCIRTITMVSMYMYICRTYSVYLVMSKSSWMNQKFQNEWPQFWRCETF